MADGIKFAYQLTLRCRDYLGLPGWAQCNPKWKKEAEEKSKRKRCNDRSTG